MSSSKLHLRVGDILQSSKLFKNYKTIQECPVKKIDPSYPNSRHRFDWVIIDIFTVIECHGQQHYSPTSFGNGKKEDIMDIFWDQKFRDNQKMNSALKCGYTYIVVPYYDYDILNEDYLWNLYNKNYNDSRIEKTANSFIEERKLAQKKYIKEAWIRKKRYLKEARHAKNNRYKENNTSTQDEKVGDEK